MRSRLFFPGDCVLAHATSAELKLHFDQGQLIGVGYQITGEILSPFDDDDPDGGGLLDDDKCETARQLVTALLAKGGPPK